LKKLASEASTGIVGDEKDLARRNLVFGENTKPLPEQASFWGSIMGEIRNVMWVAVGISAIFAGLCGVFFTPEESALEAVAIIIVALLIILVSSGADWLKDSRFVLLHSGRNRNLHYSDHMFLILHGHHEDCRS